MFDKKCLKLLIIFVLPLAWSCDAVRGQDTPMAAPSRPGPCYTTPFGPVVTTPVPMPKCECHGRRHKARCQAKFLGYPEEFNEWPLGWSLYTNNNIQVANGYAAR